jgi:hypothetical protein
MPHRPGPRARRCCSTRPLLYVGCSTSSSQSRLRRHRLIAVFSTRVRLLRCAASRCARCRSVMRYRMMSRSSRASASAACREPRRSWVLSAMRLNTRSEGRLREGRPRRALTSALRLRPRNLPRRVGLTGRLMWRIRRSQMMPMPRLPPASGQRRLRVPTENRLTSLRSRTLVATGMPKQPQTSVPSSSRKISVSLSCASASRPTHTSQTLRSSQAGPSDR